MSSESTIRPKTDENLKIISKYFIHGFAFSLIMTALVFVWVFIIVLLTAIGSLIGLMIGFIALLFILSGLNSFLTEKVWSISIKTEWMSLLGHGIILFMALIIAHIPLIITYLIAPSLTIAMLFYEAFIDGIVAKNVASWWKEEDKVYLKRCVNCGSEIPIASEECPYCRSKTDATKYCPKCGKKIPNGFKVCPNCVLNVNLNRE